MFFIMVTQLSIRAWTFICNM